MPAIELKSEDQLEGFGRDLVICNFWADWCKPCVQLNAIFDQLADSYPNIHFVNVEAEKLPEVTEKMNVSAVPAFVFIKNGAIFDRVDGANSPELVNKVEKYSKTKDSSAKKKDTADQKKTLQERLKKLINFAPVMLFMKGTPSSPECGFSSKIVELLKTEGIPFESFNILSDEEVRQGLKSYSNWPTFPQLYANGKLVGGLDIVRELQEEGELAEALAGPKKVDLETRVQEILAQSSIMLFMKGTPDSPQCGFSKTIVEILKNNKTEFGSFNILEDEEIRQGLKKLKNWPTYPQLYVKGELIGGLDIVKQMDEDGDLADALAGNA